MQLSQIVIGVIWTHISMVVSQTYEAETALRTNLSTGYNRFVRPSSPTNVTLYYNIRTLQDLDITEQQMTLTGWLTLYWYDQRLVWDNSYQISSIEIDWGWRPEFVISNSASKITVVGFNNDYTRIRAYNNGIVKWNQLLHSTTSCTVDISNFPFDSQSCEVEIIFWGSAAEEVVITNRYKTVQTDVYIENAEWQFDSSSTTHEWVTLCCPYSVHPVLRITLMFTRLRPFYVINLIFPTVLLSLCTVWAFMLPTDSGERLGYSLTILLAYTVQLSITSQLMPTTSKQIPHIARYLLIVLVLCSVVTCNVVLHVKLFYLDGPVYGWLKPIYRNVYPIVFLQCCFKKKRTQSSDKNDVVDIRKDMQNINNRKQDLSEQEVTSNEKKEQKEEVTWAKVSVLMDRICFYLYVVAVSCVNGTFLHSIS